MSKAHLSLRPPILVPLCLVLWHPQDPSWAPQRTIWVCCPGCPVWGSRQALWSQEGGGLGKVRASPTCPATWASSPTPGQGLVEPPPFPSSFPPSEGSGMVGPQPGRLLWSPCPPRPTPRGCAFQISWILLKMPSFLPWTKQVWGSGSQMEGSASEDETLLREEPGCWPRWVWHRVGQGLLGPG